MASPAYIYGDTVNAVLNTARSRISDLIQTPTGSPTGADPGQQLTQVGGATLLAELNDDSTLCLRTQIIFNSAWRKFQKDLGNLGYRLLIGDNLVISSLPANSNVDPTVQSWLSWNGFFDGTTFTSTPALPQSFIAPLKIRERITGQNSIFRPMRCALDGINSWQTRGIVNSCWEWRGNALYLPGATQITDLQIRYTTYLPDFVATGSPSTPWYYQLIPIPRALSALAWYVAFEVCFPRGDEPGAAGCRENMEQEMDQVFNDQARADQRTNNRRRPRGHRGRGGAGAWGWGGQ